MINELRFSGLASGMDTESIIKKLMDAERIPLNKLKQKRQLEEWRRDAFREMNSLLRELRDLSSNMRLQGTYLKNTATSSVSSVATVSASGNATPGSYTLTVNQLASSASVTSVDSIGQDPSGALGLSDSITITGSAGSSTITIDPSWSINTLVGKINELKGTTGVQVSYDTSTDRLFFTSTTQGSSASIQIDTSASVADVLKLAGTTVADTGSDALVNFNGMDFAFSSNNISINGLSMNLLSSGQTTITVTKDTQGVFDSIVQFVDKYNEVIDKINAKLSERKYRDYQPLTDEQKEELSEKQIELWEEKAKSGLLQSDPILSGVLGQLRKDWSTNVEGLPSTMDSMFDLGFKTGSYEQKGKIIIDEAKLKDALANNTEEVMKLFTNRDTSTDTSDTYETRGIAARLYNSLTKSINDIIDKAGSSTGFSMADNSMIGKTIKGIDERIDAFEDRLLRIEDRYWRQFTAMEKAIQQANAQSGWLMQQFGGGM